MKAVFIEQPGGVENLRFAEFPAPDPGEGKVLVRIAAAGVNFIDVYQRTGLYKVPLPAVLGMEGAGTIEAVGPGVTDFRAGDRVAWAMHRGSYAELAAVPASHLVPIPEGVDLKQAAAVMLQGMTAHYLTHSTFPLGEKHTALVHAAAGGTGSLIVQMARLRGARVIGTVSTPEKAELARRAGANEVILYTQQDFLAETKRLTGGHGVDVVYDSVGVTTWEKSLESLRPRGMLVLFGQSSGPVPPIDPLLLSQKGSVFLTRPNLAHHIASRSELSGRAADIFQWLREGKLILQIGQTYPLADAAEAHRDLESRRTSGKSLLLVK